MAYLNFTRSFPLGCEHNILIILSRTAGMIRFKFANNGRYGQERRGSGQVRLPFLVAISTSQEFINSAHFHSLAQFQPPNSSFYGNSLQNPASIILHPLYRRYIRRTIRSFTVQLPFTSEQFCSQDATAIEDNLRVFR